MKTLIIAIVLGLILFGVASYGLANSYCESQVPTNDYPVVFEHHPVTRDNDLPPGVVQQDPLRTAYLIVDEFGNIKEVSKEEYEAIR